jgi:hypothetical protein
LPLYRNIDKAAKHGRMVLQPSRMQTLGSTALGAG